MGVHMPDLRSDSTIEATPVGGRDEGVAGGPSLVLRPRLVVRLAGPFLIVVGVVGAIAGFPVALVLSFIGLLGSVAWVPSVTVDDREIRFRGVFGTDTILLTGIDEVRLRRVPFGPKRPGGHNLRFGRFCTTPMRLRVMEKDITLAQITVVYWEGWADLVRYLLSIPTIGSEGRTRGRLDRYG